MIKKKIIFFGDSLSAGYGLQQPYLEALPALIGQKILAAALPYVVINAGVSGDTTRSAKARVDELLFGDIDLFIIELGANDFLRAYSPSEISGNIKEIIKKVRSFKSDTKILLLGLSLPLWIPDNFGSRYAGLFSLLAKETGTGLIEDFLQGVSGNNSLNMSDGVHPLAEGYKIAAENIWPEVYNILKS